MSKSISFNPIRRLVSKIIGYICTKRNSRLVVRWPTKKSGRALGTRMTVGGFLYNYLHDFFFICVVSFQFLWFLFVCMSLLAWFFFCLRGFIFICMISFLFAWFLFNFYGFFFSACFVFTCIVLFSLAWFHFYLRGFFSICVVSFLFACFLFYLRGFFSICLFSFFICVISFMFAAFPLWAIKTDRNLV